MWQSNDQLMAYHNMMRNASGSGYQNVPFSNPSFQSQFMTPAFPSMYPYRLRRRNGMRGMMPAPAPQRPRSPYVPVNDPRARMPYTGPRRAPGQMVDLSQFPHLQKLM